MSKTAKAVAVDWPSEIAEEDSSQAEQPSLPTPTGEEVARQYVEQHGSNDELDQLIRDAILAASPPEEALKRRGLVGIVPGPLDVSEVEVLTARLAAGHHRAGLSALDLMDGPRCLLRRGRVQLGGREAEAFLLNDCLLVALSAEDSLSSKRSLLSLVAGNKKRCQQPQESKSTVALVAKARIEIKDVVEVRRCKEGFEVSTRSRTLSLKAADEERWVDEMASAVLAARSDLGQAMAVGARHSIVAGTAWRAALDDASYVGDDDLDALDSDGWAAAHLAAYWGHTKCLVTLLSAGADVDVIASTRDEFDGATPLHAAAIECRAEAVFALLERGAKADALDASGRSVFAACASSAACDASPAAAERFLLALPKDASALHRCSERGYSSTARLLVSVVGCNPSWRRPDGSTPLHVASIDAARALLALGAKPNARNVEGRAPLDVALLEAKDPALAVLLARRGARTALAQPLDVAHATAAWDADACDRALDEESLPSERFDSSSGACALCDEVFSNRWRRHHCRACGDVCCQACSTKTLRLLDEDANGCKPVKPDAPKRVCDACFNKYHPDLEGDRNPVDGGARDATAPARLLGHDKFHDLGDNMRRRGEQLQHLASRSDLLQSAAAQFRDNARKLRQQLQRRP